MSKSNLEGVCVVCWCWQHPSADESFWRDKRGTKAVGPMLAASNYVHMISAFILVLALRIDCPLRW